MTSNASSEECQNFLAVVHQKALEEAKYLDDKWITFYAESLLRDDALVFYESLDTKTKASWAAVRTAFVDRYVRRPDGTLYPSASTPNPAAAPPNTAPPSIGYQKGRIAVLRDNREKLYLSSQLGSQDDGLKICESSTDAQIVSFTASGTDPFDVYAGVGISFADDALAST
ncbi:hypothetical protein FRC04_011252 [Tulasnella sp. 424]|nr:hypothetical protein FRC04_011252 [Tulasnella sp. 424]